MFYDERKFVFLFSSADLHNFAPEDKVKDENDMTTERDIQNQIDFSWDKGLEIGLEKGDTNRQIKVAVLMLKDNMSISLISKYTGLSEEQILALK